MQYLDLERADLVQLLGAPDGLRGIELGVAGGDYSARLWRTGKFRELWGVDAYADHHDTAEYVGALKLVGIDANYRLLRMYFDEAIKIFPDEYFDFVYIDGYAHTGENAGKTLYEWHAKVKVGGLIAGHDYHEDWPLVVKAVNRFAADAGMQLMLTKLTSDPGPQDKYPSWASRRVSAVTPPYPDELRSLALARTSQRGKERAKDIPITAGITASRSFKKILRGFRAEVKKKLPNHLKVSTASLQGSRQGKRCLIVGSAPSVKALDLSRVHDCDVFALNRAGEVCRHLDAGEKMLVVSDPLALNKHSESSVFEGFDRVFLSADVHDIQKDNVYWFEFYRRPRVYEGFAQSDLRRPLYHCHTVAGFAIQIAVAMGYRQVYLVGIDLSFAGPQVHFYPSSSREEDWAREVSVPKTPRMAAGIAYLAYWSRKRGVDLVNLSPVPMLEGVRTANFADVFDGTAMKVGSA
jgi:hypothetical protein